MKRSDLLKDQSQEALAWADIKNSEKRGQVLMAQAIGIEVIDIGSIREECLKLDYKGIFGYLPKRLIDNYEFKGLQNFLGKVFEFTVNYIDYENQIFGADRIKALATLSDRFWRSATKGRTYEAFVRGVDPFNLYLLVEGVPTKMHRNDFSFTFYEDLREIVDIGDIIEVKLLDFTPPSEEEEESEEQVADDSTEDASLSAGQISVSRKALETDPWQYINEYKEKSTYLGIIRKVHMDHGLFIELPRGISVRANFPPNTDHTLLAEGESVNVKIQSIDKEKRSIKAIVITPRQSVINKKKARTSRRGIINER